jgi:hypothetical protein|tara:strand:+ start:297 stop:488 length:192 start_codon:yes stop_codon:yes gene_type:complete
MPEDQRKKEIGIVKKLSISIATAQDDMLDEVLKMSDLEDIQNHITELENLMYPILKGDTQCQK